LHELADVLRTASQAQDGAWPKLRERWADRILGPERDDEPSSYHVAYLRRMSPLASLYTKDRAVPICLETLSKLGFDLASDDHIITRAQGGLHDYQSFLHEAGHALHYAGCDPTLPYTFRRLARDHALTEIYSFLVESISREAGWQSEHFDLDPEGANDHA